MHVDEVDTGVDLVRRLLAAQFPEWSALPIQPVPSAGTDHALYRIGDGMVVRLPRIQRAVGEVDKDLRWLPLLAPLLPVELPLPLAKGLPAEGYPWEWGVYTWLEGENPKTADDPTRIAIAELEETIDTDATAAAWEAALQTPVWSGPPVWVHGDLSPGNLLLRGGRLTAVIDCAGLGVGDPACDLIVGWNLLPADARKVFHHELGIDDATWARGRGWAFSVALIQLPYYRDTNAALADNARHVIREVLAECTG